MAKLGCCSVPGPQEDDSVAYAYSQELGLPAGLTSPSVFCPEGVVILPLSLG